MKINKVLMKIAAEHGVSVMEVRQDIQAALDEGWNNPSPEVQNYWRKIPSRFNKPTVEEVIDYIAKEANQSRQQ